MAIDDNIVAVVTPIELQAFILVEQKDGTISVDRRTPIRRSRSVGFAQVSFGPASANSCLSKLYLCICRHDGLFAYSILKDRLLSNNRLDDDFSLVWSKPKPSHYVPEERSEDQYKPLFGSHCATLSWLANGAPLGKQVRFVTLPLGIPSSEQLDPPLEYDLGHPDMPAMWAYGVYDYDEGLGCAIFGNAFGEFALFFLGSINVASLRDCFEPLRITTARSTDEIVSQVAIPATFSPPFPYCGPRVPSDRYRDALLSRWRLEGESRCPDPLPEGWWRIPCAGDGEYSIEDWARLIPRMPVNGFDIGWELENAFHLLGPLVPLVRDHQIRVYSVGGLLLAWPEEEFMSQKVSASVWLDELLLEIEDAEDTIGFRVGEYYREDELARVVSFRYWNMWNWEHANLGRNRWREFQDRGGDVHPDWTEYVSRWVKTQHD